MAKITLEELYRGEGAGAKYGGIMNRVAAELLTRGHPAGYDEQTWLELQFIRHTLLIAEQMRKEGDCVRVCLIVDKTMRSSVHAFHHFVT